MDKHNTKVAAVQESKLTIRSKDPSIPHFTTMHQDRQQGQGGGLLFFIHESVNFSKATTPAPTAPDPHLEAQSVTIQLKNLDLLITNVYIPPASSCTNGYQASIDHLLTGDDALVLGDFTAHHRLWYSTTTDARGNKVAEEIDNFNYGCLKLYAPTRVPTNVTSSSPDISLASLSTLTASNWQTVTTLNSDHLPIIISLQTTVVCNPAQHLTYVNLKKARWVAYRQKVEVEVAKLPPPANVQRGEKLFRQVLPRATIHHIPMGRYKLNSPPLPAEITRLMEERSNSLS